MLEGFPVRAMGLVRPCVRGPRRAKGLRQAYLKKDGARRSMGQCLYEPRVGGDIEIISLGADGRQGGAEEDGGDLELVAADRLRRRGFALLELIVVLAIAGLLFSLGGPSVRTLAATMEYRDAVGQIVSSAKNARRVPLRRAYRWTC